MTHPTFVSVDGPKGSGKTTLLKRLQRAMSLLLDVAVYSEKELDPYRQETEALIERYGGDMPSDVEMEIVKKLAAGRLEITKSHLSQSRADVVLIDRWYPSDAYFRRHVPFRDVLRVNVVMGVAQPDLILATVCHPLESWRRATTRPRGLASRAGLTREQHVAATIAFEQAIEKYNFTCLPTDGTVEDTVERARDAILHVMGSAEPAKTPSPNSNLFTSRGLADKPVGTI